MFVSLWTLKSEEAGRCWVMWLASEYDLSLRFVTRSWGSLNQHLIIIIVTCLLKIVTIFLSFLLSRSRRGSLKAWVNSLSWIRPTLLLICLLLVVVWAVDCKVTHLLIIGELGEAWTHNYFDVGAAEGWHILRLKNCLRWIVETQWLKGLEHWLSFDLLPSDLSPIRFDIFWVNDLLGNDLWLVDYLFCCDFGLDAMIFEVGFHLCFQSEKLRGQDIFFVTLLLATRWLACFWHETDISLIDKLWILVCSLGHVLLEQHFDERSRLILAVKSILVVLHIQLILS